jgi:hypothetical protein
MSPKFGENACFWIVTLHLLLMNSMLATKHCILTAAFSARVSLVMAWLRGQVYSTVMLQQQHDSGVQVMGGIRCLLWPSALYKMKK